MMQPINQHDTDTLNQPPRQIAPFARPGNAASKMEPEHARVPYVLKSAMMDMGKTDGNNKKQI